MDEVLLKGARNHQDLFKCCIINFVGELIQFRVLLLDRLLRPYGPGPLDILIKDSQSNVIKKWTGVTTTRGLFTADLPLSSEPNLGDWAIEVGFKTQKEVLTITVAEYVLPKFNVEIELPHFATFTDSKIVARIRSRWVSLSSLSQFHFQTMHTVHSAWQLGPKFFPFYSYVYGKPVKGEVVVAAYPSIHSSYLQPVFNGISRKTVPIDGMVDVTFDLAKELGYHALTLHLKSISD